MSEAVEFNMYEAKTHFSRLVARAEEGEEITISRAGRPVARIVPISSPRLPRRPGVWKGKVVIHDDFDELPEEIAAAFRGERP